MPTCEDAPCCGCCGYALDMADFYAEQERAQDPDYYDEF
jgi:hypothetical protein